VIPDYIDKWEKIRWGRSGLEAELCGVLRIRSTLGRHQTNPIAPQAHSQASPTTWKGTAPLVHGSAVEAQPAFLAVRYLVPQLMILLSAPRQGSVPVPQQHQAKKESHSFLYYYPVSLRLHKCAFSFPSSIDFLRQSFCSFLLPVRSRKTF